MWDRQNFNERNSDSTLDLALQRLLHSRPLLHYFRSLRLNVVTLHSVEKSDRKCCLTSSRSSERVLLLFSLFVSPLQRQASWTLESGGFLDCKKLICPLHRDSMHQVIRNPDPRSQSSSGRYAGLRRQRALRCGHLRTTEWVASAKLQGSDEAIWHLVPAQNLRQSHPRQCGAKSESVSGTLRRRLSSKRYAVLYVLEHPR